MSFRALNWAWEADTETSGRKLVLVGLAQFTNDRDECWPSQKTLAIKTLQSERTVREHLAWLEDAGFISRIARVGANDRKYNSDLIRLNTNFIKRIVSEDPAAKFAGGYESSGEIPQSPAAKNNQNQRRNLPPNSLRNNQENINPPYPPLMGGQSDSRFAGEQVEVAREPQAATSPKIPFERELLIYSAYPKKSGKGAALKAISKALKIASFETLMEATEAFAECVSRWQASDVKYAKDPATWFNQQCWEDDRSGWEKNAKTPKPVPAVCVEDQLEMARLRNLAREEQERKAREAAEKLFGDSK